MSASLLIIDDDLELCALLQAFLAREGFTTAAIHDGAQAVEHCRDHTYDVLILDIMLPSMQGLEVLRRLREYSRVPVLMLTARGEDTDRIVGLEMGADDYLPKPCNPRELAARLRAILRRSEHPTPESDRDLHVGGLTLSNTQRSAHYDGHELPLTSAEFNLLSCLARHAGQVVDKETLCRNALGRPLSAYDRSVDVHISKLRRKLTAAGGDSVIVNVRGVGYQYATSTGD